MDNRSEDPSTYILRLMNIIMYTPAPNISNQILQQVVVVSKGIKIAKDAITYCTSGLIDRNRGSVCLIYIRQSKD